MNDYGIKTTSGNRLVWYREKADENHWYQRFREKIESSHQQISGSVPKLVRHLASVLPRRGKILEAGCGTGWIVAALADQGFDIEGVDFSGELISEVRAFSPDLQVRSGNVCKLEVPDNYYNGYVSLGVIEHAVNGPKPFLQEAYRIVKPGGVLCISVPYFNLLRRIKADLRLYKGSPGNLDFYQYAFSKEEFTNILVENGLTVDRYIHYGTARNFAEELYSGYNFITHQRLLWRLPRFIDHFDGAGLSHMVMAVARKLER